MQMKIRLLVALLLVIGVTVTGCGKGQAPDREIVIGEFGSLTGTTAAFGISARNGIDMAMKEINEKGGIHGKKIRIIVEDDQGKPEEAQTVVTKLISRDRVVAVLGEVSSSRSLAAAPVCQSSQIPMISPASTTPKLTAIGDYIFRVCFIDTFQGPVAARFVRDHLHLKRVAILRDIRNEYSVGLAEFFAQYLRNMGGDIVADESYGEGDTDFSAQLTSIRSKDPEAIFVPGYYTEVGLIARQARKLGLTVPLIGGDGWDSARLWQIGGEALNGCYFVTHYSLHDPNPIIQNFVAKYKKSYGEQPDTNAVLAYDAANILFAAFEQEGSSDPKRLRDTIARTKDFMGVTGKITLDQDRNAVKPAIVVRVNNGDFEYITTINP